MSPAKISLPTSGKWPRNACRKRGPAIRNRTLVWTATARADLLEDYIFIARQDPSAAARFVLDLEGKLRTFAALGLTGIGREDLGKDIRSFAYKQRGIYVRASENEVIVLRILHGRQDISHENFESTD